MENKYQEAYLKLLKVFNNIQLGINKSNTLEIIQQFNTIKELVDKTKILTLEEIKQEWEEEGFEVICSKEKFEAYKQWIERRQKVSHHTSAKVVIEKDFFYIVGDFSNKYTYLLTKTFKVLGRLDDENR